MKTVTLISGKTIEVLPQEIEGLRQAGLLAEDKKSKAKEDKDPGSTKEDKSLGETKEAKVKATPPPKRPVNISATSIMNKAQAKIVKTK